MGSSRARADAGEMFVEALIAAAIVAMALAATYRVIADSASRDRGAEARREALLVAQSELADVGAEIPLQVGRTQGVSGDMTWRMNISPYGEPNAAGALLNVAVTVAPAAGGPTLARLQTLRLGVES